VRLSGTYKARGGESWDLVARQTTGNDTDAAAIKRANPAVQEPIAAGTVIQVPMARGPSEVVSDEALDISVEGTKIGTFDNFELALAIDAISKCAFSVPNKPETREIFVPLGSQRITVDHLGERLFTGRCESPRLNNDPSAKILDISCYSNPGVLELCTPSIEKFPLEWKDALLEQITEDLCGEHGISVRFDTPTSARFKRVDIESGQGILSFLSGLASQRGLVISDSAFGELLLHGGEGAGEVVSFLEKGKHPTEAMVVSIDESKYYSSVTGIVPAKSRKWALGAKFTVKNPHATDVVRAYSFDAEDIDKGELEKATNSVAGRMFAELVSCDVNVATWQNDLGKTYQPGQLVSLKSEEDFIPEPFEFLVAMVTLKRSAGIHSASLNLVLPGVYSGKIPERMPWQ
jgi:prophage tail gpP-like protein